MIGKYSRVVYYCRRYSGTMSGGKQLKTVLIDLSGTLHIEHDAIGDSVEALKKLRTSNYKIKFVTNTTRESAKSLFDRLRNIGFELQQDEIYTSLHAVRDLLKHENLKPLFMIDKAAREDFHEFHDIKEYEINAVVIGLAPAEFNYDHLNRAFRFIMSGAKLIAIHEGRYIKQQDGLSLGPGPFVKALEYATDQTAIVVGKPTGAFFRAALQDEDPECAVMIGDDVRDDIEGAQKLGIRGILVKTGKYLPGDENKISPPPAEIADNFSQAVEKIMPKTLYHP